MAIRNLIVTPNTERISNLVGEQGRLNAGKVMKGESPKIQSGNELLGSPDWESHRLPQQLEKTVITWLTSGVGARQSFTKSSVWRG